jgi:hypothetical protein
VGVSTIDGDYLRQPMIVVLKGIQNPPVNQVRLDKRGFVSSVFDGRYKFARYYAPSAFNTPQTFEEILKNNDVQLFDLETDPDEMHNLANRATILRMNGLLNDLVVKEVGVNDGRSLSPTGHSPEMIATQTDVRSCEDAMGRRRGMGPYTRGPQITSRLRRKETWERFRCQPSATSSACRRLSAALRKRLDDIIPATTSLCYQGGGRSRVCGGIDFTKFIVEPER